MTKTQLLAVAQAQGVAVSSSEKKADIINAILGVE
jgi:hypothetical protein